MHIAELCCIPRLLRWIVMACPLQPRHQWGGQGLNYSYYRLLFPPLPFREARTGNASSTLWAPGRNSSPILSAVTMASHQLLLPLCEWSYYNMPWWCIWLRLFNQWALLSRKSVIMLFIWSQLCKTVALSPNVPREMMLSVILLHSLNNKAGLQKTVPAEVSVCLYVNWFADKGDNMNSNSVFEHCVHFRLLPNTSAFLLLPRSLS